ncbi:RepA family replication protein [Enterobacter ludwigii]
MTKLATPARRTLIKNELRRRCGISPFWVNQANQYGLDSACELMLAILDDLDLTTWQTRHNLETLSRRAGLETTSNAGSKSISRGSHACDRIVQLGLIISDKALFNPYDARCMCRQIEVVEHFFAVLGIPLKEVYRERARLLNADVAELIPSWDARLIVRRQMNIDRMNAAGLLRMQAKRERAREEKKAFYSPTPA